MNLQDSGKVFVGGRWIARDDARAIYQDMIDEIQKIIGQVEDTPFKDEVKIAFMAMQALVAKVGHRRGC